MAVLIFVNMAAGLELADRLSNLEPKARGRIVWFMPFSAIFFAPKHWEELKYPFVVWIGSALLALLALAGLVLIWSGSQSPA